MIPQPTASAALAPSRPVYDGKLGELYAIYLRHLLLMLLTLGLSRFWGRTRIRRYLWNHFSILGDRFEYRGRGLELMIGFLIVVAILAVWAGVVWAIWHFGFRDRSAPGLDIIDVVFLSIGLIGVPLAFVGQYSGLRYKLSRTRWRGIRCAMDGSAWSYGALATGLTFANAMTARLLTPVVSVNLARPRIAHAHVGTQGFEFAGRAGDIYGRYVGYYFLNIGAWIVAVGIAVAAVTGSIARLGGAEFEEAFTHPGPKLFLTIAVAAFAAYLLFGVMILPLRCWWRAYLYRYLVSHTRAGTVLFATALTTRQMWGFLVLNYLIVMLTLGLGWPWVIHRTMRLIAGELWVYGEPDGAAIGQPPQRPPRFGEGLLDMFDVSSI
ncbi:YjgN family protein [Enhydrobacter aerosaccus]|uniref:YjgN family protein n=1 Tax=Enhydrobacter aerosaccus TaxID=225324 RepID=UPI001481E256|nr:DUF898 family protein [Enhydrobacter aerosaccus]